MREQYETVGSSMRILLYILSVLVPLAGIIVGVLFLMRPEPDYKHVGKMCLIISIFCSIIIPLVLAIVVFAAVLSF